MPISSQLKIKLNPSANGCQKMLNKRKTQNENVFQICLHHPETINSVSLNTVLQIRSKYVQLILPLEVSCLRIAADSKQNIVETLIMYATI